MILFFFIQLCFAHDFKAHLTAPVHDTRSKYILIAGTVTSLLSLNHDRQVDKDIHKGFNDKDPLGDFSTWGDSFGQGIPNILYVGSMAILNRPNDRDAMIYGSLYPIGISTLLKYTVKERRPHPSQDRTSFPSGHTTSAFAFASVIGERHGLAYGIPAYGAAIVTGLSRVQDNRHHFHDILAGATIGTIYGMSISHLYQKNEVAWVPVFSLDSNQMALMFFKDY